jgi:uncharacterized protein (TIGR03435 family)
MRLLPLGILVALCSSLVVAQSQTGPAASASRPTFEVASIKPNKSSDSRSRTDAAPNGRVTATNVPLNDLVRTAFELQPQEMVMGDRAPAWITTDRWDIEAKATGEPSPQQMRAMLRNLLLDRFKLVSRRDVRNMPAFALVLARNDRQLGPQLRRSMLDCEAQVAAARVPGTTPGSVQQCGGRSSRGTIATFGVPLSSFAKSLSAAAGRYVFDATGLTDRFDLTLKWTPDPDAGAATPSDAVSLFTAIQEQLGLRLEPRQAPVDVFVIESAEPPTEN